MNENIDLTKILKDCPKGIKFYSTIYGEVEVTIISNDNNYPIRIFCPTIAKDTIIPLCKLSKDGKYNNQFNGECILFPSRDQRDWSKFTAPWYKKEKFDPNTLKPFDRVLARNFKTIKWRCEHFSHFDGGNYNHYIASCCSYTFCIPYNDDTKHLVGTADEAPEYYRYWEE